MDDDGLDTDLDPSEDDPVRGRFERAISLVAPLLDVVLAVGDRISRVAEPVDYEYYPVRDEADREEDGRTGNGTDDASR